MDRNTKLRLFTLVVLGIFAFLLFSSLISALGVTPARTTIGFNPGLEQTVKITVVNSEYKDINLKVFVQGELNQSIVLSEREFSMSSSEESKDIYYTFTLPESLSPGTHNADIIILQDPQAASASEAFVGATVAVVTQLIVNVPYPGKYVVADLNVLNAEQNAQATFLMPVVSLGSEDIDSAYAKVDIFDSNNNKVDSFTTNSINVKTGARGEIVSYWVANVPLGKYTAKAVLNYDGNILNLEKTFAIGNETLELQQVTVPNFELGGIAKFEMLIENKWSEPIIGAYSETKVFKNDGNLLAEFKSPTYDLQALTKSIFVSYWDTAGVNEGTYNTSVFMKYGSRYSQQNIQLKVDRDEIIALGLGFVISEQGGRGKISNVIIIGVIILVLVNVAWFLVLRKKVGRSKTIKTVK